MRVTRIALGVATTTAAAAALALIVMSGNGGHGAQAAGPSEPAQPAGLPVPVIAVVRRMTTRARTSIATRR